MSHHTLPVYIFGSKLIVVERHAAQLALKGCVARWEGYKYRAKQTDRAAALIANLEQVLLCQRENDALAVTALSNAEAARREYLVDEQDKQLTEESVLETLVDLQDATAQMAAMRQELAQAHGGSTMAPGMSLMGLEELGAVLAQDQAAATVQMCSPEQPPLEDAQLLESSIAIEAAIEAAAMEGLLAVRDAHSKLQIAQRQLQEAHERAEHECATARTARSEVEREREEKVEMQKCMSIVRGALCRGRSAGDSTQRTQARRHRNTAELIEGALKKLEQQAAAEAEAVSKS